MSGQRLSVGIMIVALLIALIPSTYKMSMQVWHRLPGQPALDLLLNGELLSDDGFARIRSSRERALAFADDSQDAIELGLAETFESLMRDDISADRASELRQSSIRHLNQGLTKAPISYNGWYILALANFIENDIEAAAMAFEANMLLTPFAGHNLSSRLRLGMAMWNELSEAAQEQIKKEILFGVRFRPFALVKLAHEVGIEKEVRALLATAEDAQKLLERFGAVQLRYLREAAQAAAGG